MYVITYAITYYVITKMFNSQTSVGLVRTVDQTCTNYSKVSIFEQPNYQEAVLFRRSEILRIDESH